MTGKYRGLTHQRLKIDSVNRAPQHHGIHFITGQRTITALAISRANLIGHVTDRSSIKTGIIIA